MTEVKVSPKKIPIDDWVKRVKSLEPTGLKDEEKKVFETVKAHKNIPKSPAKFSNFCIHNLKVKDEKLINRIWGKLSVALSEQAKSTPTKVTKEDKKAKLEKKLKPADIKKKEKAAKKNNMVHAKSDDDDDNSEEAGGTEKSQPAKQNKVAQKEESSPKDSPSVQATPKDAKVANNEKGIMKQRSPAAGNKKQVEKAKPNAKVDQKQNNKKADGKQGNAKVEQNKNQAKQEVKKKVSFSKNGSPAEPKAAAKTESLSKLHKPTPKKALNGKKGAAEDSDEGDSSALSDSDDFDDIDMDDEEASDFIDEDDDELSMDEDSDEDLDDEDLDDDDDSDDDDLGDDDDDEEEEEEEKPVEKPKNAPAKKAPPKAIHARPKFNLNNRKAKK